MTRQESVNKLIKLAQEHPELPVIPMVDGEICEDEYSYWMGSFGCVEIGEYVVGKKHYHVHDDDSYGFADVLNDTIGGSFDWNDKQYVDILSNYCDLPWEKAIIVYIEVPDYFEE